MPGTPTTRLALPTISGATDAVSSYPSVNLSQMTTLDNAVTFSSGTLAARPAAALSGRTYYATDVNGGTYFKDTGSAWLQMMTFGFSPLAIRQVTGNVTAVAGDLVEVLSGSPAITLPASPATNSLVGVFVAYAVTGAAPVTVSAGASHIFGVGCFGASSILLGTPDAMVILQYDGANWLMLSGQQDTGWVAPTFGTGWSDGGLDYPVAARLVGASIELCGAIIKGSTNTNSFGTLLTLPATVRPGSQAYPTASYLGPSGAAGGLALQVTTAGVVTGLATAGASGTYTVNLDGVRFRAS